jgi:hypothetical protein
MKNLLLLSLALFLFPTKQNPPTKLTETPPIRLKQSLQSCEMTIFVGHRKDVQIGVPCVERTQLIDVATTFIVGGQNAKNHLKKVLGSASDLTLLITSKSSLEGPDQ